jgi:putative ABC transport system substrate-binding protein
MGGLVSSLARPGGNITGFSTQAVDISSKTIEVLRELVPNLARVAMIASRAIWPMFRAAQDQAAHALGIDSIYVDLPIPDAIGMAFQEAVSRQASGVIVRGTPYFSSAQRKAMVEAAAAHRMPTMYESRDYVEAGGLAAYATDGVELYRNVAGYVARILDGAIVGDLPIQQPTKFELVINLRIAKALGLTVPSRLLFTADQVVE